MNEYEIRRGTDEQEYLEQLGQVAMLMCQSKSYRLFRLATLEMWIEPAIRHRQIAFIVDHLGTTVGYLTWALLAPDVEKRLVEQPAFRMHESEWDEGRALWIMDFVAIRGSVRAMVAHVRRQLFTEYREAYSVRRDAQGMVRKKSVWKRGHWRADVGLAGTTAARQ